MRGTPSRTSLSTGLCATAAAVLLLVAYWRVHRFLPFGFISPNHDLWMDMAPLRRNGPLLDDLTKGYYSPSTGSFTPGPLYRWSVLAGLLLASMSGAVPLSERVWLWTDPSQWADWERWYLTDYGAATLGLHVVSFAAFTVASVVVWRGLRHGPLAVAVFAAPLVTSIVNLSVTGGPYQNRNFSMPLQTIGPSLIPAFSLLVAVSVPVALAVRRHGPTLLLATTGLLLQLHLMTLPLVVLGLLWAAFLLAREFRVEGASALRHGSWGLVSWLPLLLRLLAEGPGSFLPRNGASEVSLGDGWVALGVHLHLPPLAGLLVWLTAIAAAGIAALRAPRRWRLPWLGVASVLLTALTYQLFFFPSWRHQYAVWAEVVLVAYALALLVLVLRHRFLTALLVLAGSVAVLYSVQEDLGAKTMRLQAEGQRGWQVERLRELTDGRRVDVGDDEGLAGMVLYLTRSGCLIPHERLSVPFAWAFCDDADPAEVTIRRAGRELPDVPVSERFDLLGSGLPSASEVLPVLVYGTSVQG